MFAKVFKSKKTRFSNGVEHKKGDFADLLELIDEEKSKSAKTRDALKNLDLFVLDNSLRESTVGQIKGHTLENKWGILEEVKKCGFKSIIVSAFSHVPRVDDSFVKELIEKESDVSNYYAFTELGEGQDLLETPIGLKKMKEVGLKNPIIEIDLADTEYDACALLEKRIDFARTELSPDSKIFVNLRDLPFAMVKCPSRVFKVVAFLGAMPKRPMGILYEEPTGAFLVEELTGWTKALRKLMTNCNWDDGLLLVHVHKKWGYAEVAQVACLAHGANGIWASVCEEGAAVGHACSAVSIMNLVRLGNKKVLEKYNCTYLREAAINVTKHTTGSAPHDKQIVYGKRSLDLAFDFGGICGGQVDKNDFDMAKFFGVTAPKRISTLASPDMIKGRLEELFGEHEEFTLEIATKMKERMILDLSEENRKEEYMSHVGLAMLFDRAGGQMTEQMKEAINNEEPMMKAHGQLLANVREIWDEWDLKEEGDVRGDGELEFYSFYNAFMAPYFGCYECDAAKKGLQAIDMDKDNTVGWDEFSVYLKWALREYPEIVTAEELLETAFQKGLIPAMQDECVNKEAASAT